MIQIELALAAWPNGKGAIVVAFRHIIFTSNWLKITLMIERYIAILMAARLRGLCPINDSTFLLWLQKDTDLTGLADSEFVQSIASQNWRPILSSTVNH